MSTDPVTFRDYPRLLLSCQPSSCSAMMVITNTHLASTSYIFWTLNINTAAGNIEATCRRSSGQLRFRENLLSKYKTFMGNVLRSITKLNPCSGCSDFFIIALNCVGLAQISWLWIKQKICEGRSPACISLYCRACVKVDLQWVLTLFMYKISVALHTRTGQIFLSGGPVSLCLLRVVTAVNNV